MKPWELLDKATVPGSTIELRLLRRGAEYSIRINADELMNSRLSGSEEALATLTCRDLATVQRPTVLIGGLGMGFTLRAALATLNADATVIVSELVPAVVAWARGPMAALFAGSLTDGRVQIVEKDVGEIIRGHRSAFDAILLDVDNGPEGMTHEGNDQLYAVAGLTAARKALRPDGVLAVWSARPDAAFSRRLAKTGFAVEEVRVRANKGRGGASHMIWLARRANT